MQQYARDSLSLMYRERTSPGAGCEELIWNIYGIENIKKRLIHLISGAQQEIRHNRSPPDHFTGYQTEAHLNGKPCQCRDYHPTLGRRFPLPGKMKVYVNKIS